LLSVAILITLLAAIVIMSPRYLCWYFGSSWWFLRRVSKRLANFLETSRNTSYHCVRTLGTGYLWKEVGMVQTDSSPIQVQRMSINALIDGMIFVKGIAKSWWLTRWIILCLWPSEELKKVVPQCKTPHNTTFWWTGYLRLTLKLHRSLSVKWHRIDGSIRATELDYFFINTMLHFQIRCDIQNKNSIEGGKKKEVAWITRVVTVERACRDPRYG
jgi:hypothetical protein